MTSAAIRPPLPTPLLQDSPLASSHSPAEAQTREVVPINAGGYSWHNDKVDQVIRQSGEADAGRIISEAILHDNGDHRLDSEELAEAGEKLIKESMESYQWSPSALAKIMAQKKVGNQRALLQRARHLDNGDHWLSEAELREAAQTLSR
ncbi:hypothetical protein KAI87_02515, partial [Myxococcota bacterium]|nr:hypothetical protein [Myxococcota bacterium]